MIVALMALCVMWGYIARKTFASTDAPNGPEFWAGFCILCLLGVVIAYVMSQPTFQGMW